MGAIASQITSITIVYSTVYSGADQRKHQSSASLAFVRGIHRWPVNSPHKLPVTQKMFPFDDVIRPVPDTYSWKCVVYHTSLDKSMIAKYGNGNDCTEFTLLFLSTGTPHFLKNHFDVTCLIPYILLGLNDMYSHDDVIKWRYFPCYWTFVRRIHPSPVDSPHKPPATGGFPSQRPVTRGFDVFFDMSYTSDVKRRNTLSCLDQHRHRGLKLWNSRDWQAV